MGKSKGSKGGNAHSPSKSGSPAKKKQHTGPTTHLTQFHSASPQVQNGLVPRPDNPNNLSAQTAAINPQQHATPKIPSMDSFPQLTTAPANAHDTSQQATHSPLSDTASPTAHNSVDSHALGMGGEDGTERELNQSGIEPTTQHTPLLPSPNSNTSDYEKSNNTTGSVAAAEASAAAEAAAAIAAAAAAAAAEQQQAQQQQQQQH